MFLVGGGGNHQAHTHEVFNHTAHKVPKDAFSYAHIQANNAYYREVLGQKMNKKLGSSTTYLTEEQYNQVKVSKSFYTQYLILVVTWRTDSIFVQVVIPWFRNYREVYLEFCKYWSSPEFKAKSEKKRMNHGKDLKHRYDPDGHIRKSQCMVRFCGSSDIYMNIVMWLTLNYKPSGMALWGVTFRS
jgi:hypothetical protein